MNILIVYAHQEPASFNGALLRKAVETLMAAGHGVTVSDLHAMGFDPVSDRRNFTTVADATRFSQQAEERFAADHGGFAPDLRAEMDKLRAADLVIFQFPIWWMGMPAIMKGWIDRVFAVGVAYGGGRWFDRGVLSGKLAMLTVTMGGPAPAYAHDGVYRADTRAILHPINHGILGFVGFEVIEPFIVHGPGRMSGGERAQALDDYAARLVGIDTAPRLPGLASADYDNFVRKRDQADSRAAQA